MPEATQTERITLTSMGELMRQSFFRWNDVNAPRLGAALTFYTMLSIAPLLVVCVGIAGWVFGHDWAQEQIAIQMRNVIGYQGANVIEALLKQSARPTAGIVATFVGIFTLFFGASGVFAELRDSLNLVWNAGVRENGGVMGLIRYRFFSFTLVLGIGFLLLVSLVLSAAIAAAGKWFSGYLPMPELVLHLVTTVFTFVTVTVLFALLYKVVPDVKVEWRDVWIGAAATALLFSIGKFLIGLYLGKAGVGSAYGAAGSLVVFMVWVYYSAQIFFLGALFTYSYAQRHGSRAAEREDHAAATGGQFREPQLTPL